MQCWADGRLGGWVGRPLHTPPASLSSTAHHKCSPQPLLVPAPALTAPWQRAAALPPPLPSEPTRAPCRPAAASHRRTSCPLLRPAGSVGREGSVHQQVDLKVISVLATDKSLPHAPPSTGRLRPLATMPHRRRWTLPQLACSAFMSACRPCSALALLSSSERSARTCMRRVGGEEAGG